MKPHSSWIRPPLTFALTAVGLSLFIRLLSGLLGSGAVTSEEELAAQRSSSTETPTKAYIASLPREPFSVQVDRNVTPKHQSPMLDALVESGALPPVKERLPENPLVLRGVDGIGTYGGQWTRIATTLNDTSIMSWRLSYHAPVRWSPLGDPIVPHIAESVEVSEDQRVFTLHLRKGHRWSDGHPFTTADIAYWWNQEVNHPELGNGRPPNFMVYRGKGPELEVVNPHTLRILYEEPHSLFLYRMASFGYHMFETPRHYLEPFHPVLGDDEIIAAALEAYQLPNRRSLYAFMKARNNPKHPRLWPWVLRQFSTSAPITYVRNPFYFAVDEEGNQLPYIDSVRFEVRKIQQIPLEVAAGRTTMQGRNIQFADVTEYMSRRATSGIEVNFWDSADGSVWMILPNLVRRADEDNPKSVWKERYISDAKFRRALSLALNRERIIESEYSGLGNPMQVSPPKGSPFRNEEIGRLYTEYNPVEAERLLDEIGFKRRSPGAMRTAPDGTPLTFFLDYTAFTSRGPADFVVEDWIKVGVNVIAQERSRSLLGVKQRAREVDFTVWTGSDEYFPLVYPRYFAPMNHQAAYARNWGYWVMRGGDIGQEVDDGRAIEPPKDHPVRQSIALYRRIEETPDRAEQIKLFHDMQRIAAEQVYTINLSESPPQLIVKADNIRNVPENAIYGFMYASPGNTAPETYFLEGETTNPVTAEILADSIEEPVLRPGGEDLHAMGPGPVLLWSRRILSLGMFAGLIMLGLRYRFIGGRLLLMIPTLTIMSILVFIIIQAPPGDFLTSRMIELEELGDPTALRQIEELKDTFQLDRPKWRQYTHWVGLEWFLSFAEADKGILQGNLGRSMATNQPVNFVVGDRLRLTMLISLGTVLFTWLTALPIGIYSAVRQYSVADYALTVFGFIGMAIPGFLLALILMTFAGVSGLHSAEFADQPYWDVPKVLDLLKHIWVPIVVLGIGGTASMIRVMRANLLDELRKPYVVTARAKGVRPAKLLMKYPVRLALNPFVSTIGGLFPQLVSGGAVVAVVLALPTTGPLLLNALMMEDMFMAGSMLMYLSLLGIIGTLVSDLLLLWLDPRIRFEGGSR